MIWLTWRQFRTSATAAFAAVAALAAILALTGPGLADDYAAGIAACTTEGRGCSGFVRQFFDDNQGTFLALVAVVLVLPALVGLFWGAPLIARELEAGTHRLVWNQSVTRARWLAVKLGLVGLAAVAAAGVTTLAVTWGSGAIDQAAADEFTRMEPLLFAARGIVPVGYAAFAFALGVAVGLLVRRTVPAMAITLAVFVAVQVAMPMLVRPHLLPPVQATVEISESNMDRLGGPRGGGSPIHVSTRSPDAGAWVLSNHTVDSSGQAVDSIPLSTESGPCGRGREALSACFAEIKRLGYRQHVTYHPPSRFWPLQWYETGIYLGLALGLAGFCFWWIRRRLS